MKPRCSNDSKFVKIGIRPENSRIIYLGARASTRSSNRSNRWSVESLAQPTPRNHFEYISNGVFILLFQLCLMGNTVSFLKQIVSTSVLERIAFENRCTTVFLIDLGFNAGINEL